MGAIDRARGCSIRIHSAGFRVVMYKDAPGVFYDERGQKVSEAVAAQAGFDTETLGRERQKQERMAEFRKQVEAEFATEQEDTEKLLSMPSEGLHVKHIGGGKYAIMDDDGNRLTQKPLTKDEAHTLIEDLQNGGSNDGTTS